MELLTSFMKYFHHEGFRRQDLIKLGIDMCRALELCRKKEIIHRDIKPENIFISEDGNFKLGDFGVAANADKTIGRLSKKDTYSYMAPEVYKAEPYGPTVDIYSLGIILYRLLNNLKEPFLIDGNEIKDYENALDRQMKGEQLPLPLSDSGELARIVLKAASYSPLDRYSSPTEMREDLEKLVNANDRVLLFSPHINPKGNDGYNGNGNSSKTHEPTSVLPPFPPTDRVYLVCQKCGTWQDFPSDSCPEYCSKCGKPFNEKKRKRISLLKSITFHLHRKRMRTETSGANRKNTKEP